MQHSLPDAVAKQKTIDFLTTDAARSKNSTFNVFLVYPQIVDYLK